MHIRREYSFLFSWWHLWYSGLAKNAMNSFNLSLVHIQCREELLVLDACVLCAERWRLICLRDWWLDIYCASGCRYEKRLVAGIKEKLTYGIVLNLLGYDINKWYLFAKWWCQCWKDWWDGRTYFANLRR